MVALAVPCVLSASGTILAVGSNPHTDSTDPSFVTGPSFVRVYRFNPEEDSWNIMGQEMQGAIDVQDGFGYDLALSADGLTMAVGTLSLYPGYCQVYRYDTSASIWREHGKLAGR